MKRSERIQKKINNYLFDHRWLRIFLDQSFALIISVGAAIIFAFGFCAFITPASGSGQLTIVTGGASGISQNAAIIFRLCGAPEWITSGNIIQSIGYFVVNVPLLIFAWFCIGKRFAGYTLINVGCSSIFVFLFSKWDFIHQIQSFDAIQNSLITRALFGGVFIGLSSAIAFKGEISCGGLDVINYYLSNRKSTSVGKFGILTNGVIVTVYALLMLLENGTSNAYLSIISLLYSIAYIMVLNVVVDMINLRNKKCQIQIITSVPYLADILIANFPHGATMVNAKGIYTHNDRKVIYMVVSSHEVKKVTALAKKADEHAFITVSELRQVYGNFFIKPIE